MSRGLATASRMAVLVISLKVIRRTGTFGFSTCNRCQLMLSPSRSSSVASRISDASLMAFLSSDTLLVLSAGTT